MATELPRPGVSVIQQFRTVSPTIVTPTLAPCVVGPSFQIVEALETDATGNSVVNTDALASVPAILVSENAEDYTGLDGLELKVTVNNGIEQVFTFVDPTAVGLTADQVKAQILGATTPPSGFTVRTVTHGASVFVQLESLNAGDGQELRVLDGNANSVLGFADFYTAYGVSNYQQDEIFVGQLNFPDPRGNIDELDIDESSIRVFVNNGATLLEALQDESFLRNGHLAWVQGTAIAFPTVIPTLNGRVLEATLEAGGVEQVVTFDGDFHAMEGTLVVPGSAYAQPGVDAISVQKNADTLVTVAFATPVDIDQAVIEINTPWAVAYPGEDVCYRSDGVGAANPAGTFISFQVGGVVPTGDVVKVIEPFPIAGQAFDDLGFTVGQGSVSSSLIWYLNNALNSPADAPNAVDAGGDILRIVSWDGYVMVGDGDANTVLGLTDNADQHSLEGVDDGDGDTKSAIVRLQGQDFTLDPNSAQMISTSTLDADVYLHRQTFIVQLDGVSAQEIEFNGGPIVASNSVYQDPGTDSLGMFVNGTPVLVTFANPADIDAAILAINTAAGQTVCYRSDVIGQVAPAGTYISFQVGGATDAGGEIVMDFSTSTGSAWADIGFGGVVDIQQTNTQAEIVTAINAVMGAGFASVAANILTLDSTLVGVESKIEVGAGTSNTTLGFVNNQVEYGRAFKPMPGDALYANGDFLGYLVQVAPGAVSTDLRLDRKLTFTAVLKKDWYIVAKNIPSTLPANRPTPNLVVDLAGDITVKHDLLRDTRGNPVATAADPLLITYRALRLDVTSSALDAALLTFEGTAELETTLSPINTDNPLGLGIFFALLNAPGITVSGLGVDAVSADAPDGTLTAYTKAMGFLESEEVYALAPLTHDPVVHQAFQVHVNSMSEPDARGERVVLINPNMPDRHLDTLVASGTDGDTTGVVNEFDTKLSNLSSALLAAGVDPTGTITVDDGVFLDIATDANIYSVAAISGTRVSIRVAFAPGENDDNFYAVSNFPTTLISENFTIKVRGAQLLDANGDPNNQQIAETYADLATSYGDRRVIMTAPDRAGASIDSLEQLISGYYMNAAISGMVGQQPPQQGFTNFPVSGFTQVIGSNDRFSNTQMNIGAGGGVYWLIQEVAGGPLTSRHQLTTDLTSIETREFSITKVVDFTAKFMRAGLRNFIGKFNITQGFLDTLSTVVQGQLTFLAESGVLIGGDLNNIVQDTDAPDTVLIDVTLDVPYPCNYIRLTLVV